MTEFDDMVSGLAAAEPPDRTPKPGQTYQRYPGEPIYQVVDLAWQHPNHAEWAKQRMVRGQQPPFYVRTKSGEVAWVPWPGSTVVAQAERAWQMDLLPGSAADPRPSQRVKKRFGS